MVDTKSMFNGRFRRTVSTVAAAIIVTLIPTGCDPDPLPPPPLPPADPLASMHLDPFWNLQNYGCVGAETDIPQNSGVATLVKVCHQNPTSYRLLNVSQTSVTVTFDPQWTTVGWVGPHAEDGPVTIAMLQMMDAVAMEGPGFLTLPAGDSATVTLVDPNYGMPSVESDPVHGNLAFHARMVGTLVDEIPWDDIAEMNGITAKAVACAGSTLALFNSQQMAFDDALGTAETCVGMFNEISDQWAKHAAEAAPTAQALRGRITTLAGKGAQVSTNIKGLVISGVRLVFRR